MIAEQCRNWLHHKHAAGSKVVVSMGQYCPNLEMSLNEGF